MLPVKRPRPVCEEGEDDLIKLQEEFLRKKQACSTKVVRDSAGKATAKELVAPRQDDGDESESGIADNHDIPNLFGLEIVERNFNSGAFVAPPKVTRNGFPKPTHRSIDTAGVFSKSSSIFSQQFKKNAPRQEIGKQTEEESVRLTGHGSQILVGSGLVGSGFGADAVQEVEKIHAENLQRIKEMTREEIEKAQKEMTSQIDPKLLAFLKSRNKSKQVASSAPIQLEAPQQATIKAATAEKQAEVMDFSTTPSVTTQAEPIEKLDYLPFTPDDVRSSKWLHMDKIESEKLEWLKPLEPSKGPQSHQEARFDFEGNLLIGDTGSTEVDTKVGLHHHGDEPEKAGYTIGEMLTFIESSLPSQKLIGLRALGKVMEKAHKGFYDLCFDSSIIKQILEETSIPLIVRKCLDDPSASIVSAAISCLRGVIYNTELDELFLDRIFVWNATETSVPELCPELETNKLDEITDEQLVRLDPIRALLRSDLLIRLRYLIDNSLHHQNDPLVLKNVFDILTRIARHSKLAVNEMANCPYLLETIVTNFLKPQLSSNTSSVFSNPFPAALKLIRIMCASDLQLIPLLVKKFPDLLRAAQIYVTIEPSFFSGGDREGSKKFTTNDALKLVIESIRFWCVLLGSREPLISSALVSLFPVLIRQTQYLCTLRTSEVSISSFDWQFAACLILCLRRLSALEDQIAAGLTPLIESAAFTWINEITNANLVPSIDVINAVSQAIIYCLCVARAKEGEEATESSRRADALLLIRNKALLPFISSGSLWKRIMENLIDCSSVINFKNDYISAHREAANMPSFGSLIFGQSDARVSPALKSNSTLPLVHALIKVALAVDDDDLSTSLLADPCVVRYVSMVTSATRPLQEQSCSKTTSTANVTTSSRNFFEYQELLFLADLCRLTKVASPAAATAEYLALSVGLISFIRESHLKDCLVDSVIFNGQLYRTDLTERFADLGLNERDRNLVNQAVDYLAPAKAAYARWSNMDSALWVFDPITKQVQATEEEKDIDSARSALFFIMLLKTRAPSYLKQTLPSAEVEFCLIASTFLAGSDFFLDDQVSLALRWYLNHFRSLGTLNLSRTSQLRLPQLPTSTAADLFASLQDHFDAVSYNDQTFKSYLLMFKE